MRRFSAPIVAAGLIAGGAAFAANPTATINKVSADGVGEAIGTVTVVMSGDGAVLNVTLKGLPPGPHGMHLHENGACGISTVNNAVVPAGAAGGHWDAMHTGKHLGPAEAGHTGDLPVLEVIADGTATKSILAPRLKELESIRGHALVVHANGDNYADTPAPLGGGGGRIACGVIQ